MQEGKKLDDDREQECAMVHIEKESGGRVMETLLSAQCHISNTEECERETHVLVQR